MNWEKKNSCEFIFIGTTVCLTKLNKRTYTIYDVWNGTDCNCQSKTVYTQSQWVSNMWCNVDVRKSMNRMRVKSQNIITGKAINIAIWKRYETILSKRKMDNFWYFYGLYFIALTILLSNRHLEWISSMKFPSGSCILIATFFSSSLFAIQWHPTHKLWAVLLCDCASIHGISFVSTFDSSFDLLLWSLSHQQGKEVKENWNPVINIFF